MCIVIWLKTGCNTSRLIHTFDLYLISSSIIGTSVASLLMTIEEMHVLSKKMFFNSLSLHASRLMDKVQDE